MENSNLILLKVFSWCLESYLQIILYHAAKYLEAILA